ncbi:MAG: hypothetical protein IJ489_11085 [Clostridia bacterium]|nr:hypothetical protein [Clostridia bacterium]
MKKLISIILCFCTLFLLISCNQNEREEKECYISSNNLVYGNRIYQLSQVEPGEWYLTYINIGDESGEIHIGCIDPLCTHDRATCVAASYLGEVVLMPGKKAPTAYFSSIVDGRSQLGIVSLDMETGERKVVCEFSEDFQPDGIFFSFIIAGDYLYTIGRITDGSEGSVCHNIWRASLSGGEFEKMTWAEDQNAYYDLYYIDAEGYHYYVRHINDSTYEHILYRSKDFVNEQKLLDCTYTGEFPQNSIEYLKFYEGMMYYTVRMADVSHELIEEPLSKEDEGYQLYNKEGFQNIFDLAIYRMPMDGSGEPELLVKGIGNYGVATSSPYQIANGKLYYMPYEEHYLGKLDYVLPQYITGDPTEDAKKKKNMRCLSYLYAPNDGSIYEFDLETKE